MLDRLTLQELQTWGQPVHTLEHEVGAQAVFGAHTGAQALVCKLCTALWHEVGLVWPRTLLK